MPDHAVQMEGMYMHPSAVSNSAAVAQQPTGSAARGMAKAAMNMP